MHFVSEVFDCVDLAAHKRMANGGIKIAQIGDPHAHSVRGFVDFSIAKLQALIEGLYDRGAQRADPYLRYAPLRVPLQRGAACCGH